MIRHALAALLTATPDCRVMLKVQSLLPMLPPDLDLSPADQALMTAALAALKAHERGQADLWHPFATALQTAGCPAHATQLQAKWKQLIDAFNAETNFGFCPAFSLLRPD